MICIIKDTVTISYDEYDKLLCESVMLEAVMKLYLTKEEQEITQEVLSKQRTTKEELENFIKEFFKTEE